MGKIVENYNRSGGGGVGAEKDIRQKKKYSGKSRRDGKGSKYTNLCRPEAVNASLNE